MLEYRYDVALSFASEERQYVDEVYDILTRRGLKVFYDASANVQAEFIGERFSVVAQRVYGRGAYNVIMFISQSYLRKIWTVYEAAAISDRMIESYLSQSGVFLSEFEPLNVPGIPNDSIRLQIGNRTPTEFCNAFLSWRALRGGFNQERIAAYSSQNRYSEAMAYLAWLKTKDMTFEYKVVVWFNLACTISRASEDNEDIQLINKAISLLRGCFENIKRNRPEDYDRLRSHANSDDDLLYLRRARRQEMAEILGTVELNLNATGGRSGSIGCVDPSTLIETPTGMEVMSQIEVGMAVSSYSPIDMRRRDTIVIQKHMHSANERLRLNGSVVTSTSQPFYCEDGCWKPASDLQVGMKVLKVDKGFIELISIEQVGPGPVMSIAIEDASHAFIANEFVCHNIYHK